MQGRWESASLEPVARKIAPSKPTVLNNFLHGGDTKFPLRPTPQVRFPTGENFHSKILQWALEAVRTAILKNLAISLTA